MMPFHTYYILQYIMHMWVLQRDKPFSIPRSTVQTSWEEIDASSYILTTQQGEEDNLMLSAFLDLPEHNS